MSLSIEKNQNKTKQIKIKQKMNTKQNDTFQNRKNTKQNRKMYIKTEKYTSKQKNTHHVRVRVAMADGDLQIINYFFIY